MTQRDDIDFIAVRIQHERRDPNSQLQCFAGLCKSPNQRLFGRWFDTKSGVTSRIFNCRYSVFFWHLLLLEQMAKEAPGIRQPWFQPKQGQDWTNIAGFEGASSPVCPIFPLCFFLITILIDSSWTYAKACWDDIIEVWAILIKRKSPD